MKTQIQIGSRPALAMLAVICIGCDKSPRLNTQEAGSPHRIEAQPFHGEVYRSFDGRNALTLISPDELELREGNTILLCKYSKQAEALRVIVTAMGANQVVYFRFIDTGLQDNNGKILLSPQSYAAAMEQARLAREQEENSKHEAERRQRQIEAQKRAALEERGKTIIAKRDAILADIQRFCSKGRVFQGTRYGQWSYKHKDPNLPFTVSVTGSMTVDDEIDRNAPFNENFRIPAHYKWLGDTETLSSTSWGWEIKEYDGVFGGTIAVDDRKEPPAMTVRMKYFIRDGSRSNADWLTRDEGCRWNGVFFEGVDKTAIQLKPK